MRRLKEEDLDKEGEELADALHAGTGRLAGFLNQSVGKSFHILSAVCLWALPASYIQCT